MRESGRRGREDLSIGRFVGIDWVWPPGGPAGEAGRAARCSRAMWLFCGWLLLSGVASCRGAVVSGLQGDSGLGGGVFPGQGCSCGVGVFRLLRVWRVRFQG
ncbi:MAG: hypothetical protein QG608_1447 [Actinomycetota bacterium]|nr:hypothetical protein [Actinomycetota bacterium]